MQFYLVLGGDTEDTVDVNFESDFELWDTTSSWWDTGQIEFTQKMVILGHWTFTFVYLKIYYFGARHLAMF